MPCSLKFAFSSGKHGGMMIRNVLTNTAVANTAEKILPSENITNSSRKNTVHIIVEHEYVGKKSAREIFQVIAEENIRIAVNQNIRKAG